MQGFAPADEALLFRQKCPKPFPPVRGPLGPSASVPNQDGEGTRSAQTALAKRPIRYGGSAAHEGGETLKKNVQFSNWGMGKPTIALHFSLRAKLSLLFNIFVVQGFAFHCVGRGGAGVPNRLLGEGCLSRASSFAILFGTEAEGPAGPRTGKHGFGSFCRNKRDSSRGRESPHRINKYSFTLTLAGALSNIDPWHVFLSILEHLAPSRQVCVLDPVPLRVTPIRSFSR